MPSPSKHSGQSLTHFLTSVSAAFSSAASAQAAVVPAKAPGMQSLSEFVPLRAPWLHLVMHFDRLLVNLPIAFAVAAWQESSASVTWARAEPAAINAVTTSTRTARAFMTSPPRPCTTAPVILGATDFVRPPQGVERSRPLPGTASLVMILH